MQATPTSRLDIPSKAQAMDEYGRYLRYAAWAKTDATRHEREIASDLPVSASILTDTEKAGVLEGLVKSLAVKGSMHLREVINLTQGNPNIDSQQLVCDAVSLAIGVKVGPLPEG